MAHRLRWLSLVSFSGLMLLSAGLGMLIHRVSPLRDPSFVAISSNAGTLVPWMRWLPETAWVWASVALAMVTALSLTWLLYQWSQVDGEHWGTGRWLAIGTLLFGVLGLSGYTIASLEFPPLGQNALFKAGMVVAIAAMLAVTFTGMLWFWQRLKKMLAQKPEPARAIKRWGQAYSALYWAGFAASLYTVLQILFLGYLFAQHIVD
ncbi:MAG: hypothetical protein ACFCVB_14880 [Nodosilinea sp.]